MKIIHDTNCFICKTKIMERSAHDDIVYFCCGTRDCYRIKYLLEDSILYIEDYKIEKYHIYSIEDSNHITLEISEKIIRKKYIDMNVVFYKKLKQRIFFKSLEEIQNFLLL